ncbi:MAG TPA: GNAT family N-acetyltransferase, partial [Hanamia sp.]|nr:GNAT family N-acetyltransferase [Hanamia sp.]
MAYSFDICYLYGEVFLTDNKNGCGLILFPDKKKNNLKSILLDIQLIVSCIGISNIEKAMKRESLIKRLQPKKLMYYLWFVGVDRNEQNKGIGSALIKEVIEDAHFKQKPVYL